MKKILSLILALVMVIGLVPMTPMAHAEEAVHVQNELEGKTLSILGASISTYAGTSNGSAADTTNSTIRDNVKYYPNTTIPEIALNDTWWMQVCADMGLRLLVNNSWSGSSLLHTRNGTVGAYVDRCVQLHDDTGDNAGEVPDIIGIQMGTNDFQYYKDTLGTADIDYDTLITQNGDGAYSYAEPTTSLEAAAIVLHKISVRYPDAEVYYLNISQRIDGTDELIRSFNAELKQVVEHFDAHIVDIYGSAITMAEFDTYIGDGKVHPNCLGMDAYAEAFKRALLEHTAYTVDTHTVSMELDGVTADYGDDKIVVSGDSFSVHLTAVDELKVSVIMGGKDITDQAYSSGTVTIDAVTDDVTITAESVHSPKSYRWEFNGTDLVCVSGDNPLTKKSGTTTDGVFSKTSYALAGEVVLLHNLPWTVEWKCEGTFLNTGGSSGARIFTSDAVNANYNARYIFKSNTNGLIAMGEKDTKGSHNYGIALGDHGIDWTELHTYRLENRVAENGSNMIYLFVDGVEIGPMNNYYVGTADKGTTSDWLSGKDFVFPYMGTDTHGFTNCSIEYIAVWEGGHIHEYTAAITAPTCTEQGYTTYTCSCGDSYVDSYVDAAGHSYANGACTVCGTEAPDPEDFEGKSVSILSHSMSTYAGVSNNTSYNSTIGNNDVYYTAGKHGVYQKDTWWQQAIDALGMELLVNNSWSGSCVFMPRRGEASVGYGDRAVNLHNDRTGEEPEIIWVYLGCNDFAYYKDTFGKAEDVDYDALIRDNGDETFTYATPTTTCEAYAIMLHKVAHRYPDAEIYCMTSTARRETDYTGDSYPDAGQPTEYSAQLQQIAAYWGYPVVDLEKAIPKDVEIFDKYMGDKRAHANQLGMDRITNAVLSVMLGENAEIRHVTSENGVVAEQAVLLGGSYSAEVEIRDGYSVVVAMGGKDVTDEVYKDGRITIAEVTGDIAVSAVITRDPLNFRWEFKDDELTSVGETENTLLELSATVENGILNDGRYELTIPVVLKHDRPWSVEWKCAENWRGVLLSSDPAPAAGMTYLSRVNGGQLCFGVWTGTQYNNYGVDISDLDNQVHTYRLENRIAADGSNMVWLYVDGIEIGSMIHYFIGSKDQNATSDWVRSKDFIFSYIGIESHALRNCRLDYLEVTECEHIYENGVCVVCGQDEPFETMFMQYDDHLDISGKDVGIINTEGNSVVEQEGNYLVATGIGTAKVKIDGVLYEITVDKAKINIVTIMGQSNAGNHFANATSDVTCPIGTAYWWGNGQGTKATEPVDYTQPSMGFHTPLLAELYAQSAAAGDPVKNVLIWQEGITSKNGQSIVKWAASATDTSGTNDTVTMIENCLSYYEQHRDKYEIVGKGVYWLQGESDTQMDPDVYTQRFMAIWSRLENAGMEYVAFLRLRWGTNGNGEDHQDLHHSASLSAQIRMINENPEFYMATDLTENWVGTADTVYTVDISNYITVMETYGGSASYTDSYGNNATYANGKLTTTMKSLYGSNNKCHYGKFGYGLIGADAAYNMYRALNKEDVSIVMTDTSGHASRKQILANGTEVTLDITDITDNLSFRALCGSVGGTLEITVYSGGEDITAAVTEDSGLLYNSVSTKKLRQYEDISITAVYTAVGGTAHTATCQIVYQRPEPNTDYIWDFNEDMNARDAEGNICNSFLTTALTGSYTLEDGYLAGQNLQLKLEENIRLSSEDNWSVEWKYGALTNGTAGFLLCEDQKNAVGNRAFYHTANGRIMISDYADKNGYRNYTSSAVTVSENDCLRITNRFDPQTGKSTMSLWQNGKLVIADFQLKGSLNKDNDNTDMTVYPLSGDFDFGYLGNAERNTWLFNCELDYLKITFDNACIHSYENGICTVCGAEHPNLANFEGKVISILGDSISTFAGYIPAADGFNLEHLARYPQDNLLTDVNETWWMQVITALGGKLGINDSWRGATVSGAVPVTTGTTGENAAMGNLTRIQNLGANGTPDVILFYGGTNDLAHVSEVGSFDPNTAPTTVDLTTKKWDNLAEAYVHTLLRLRHFYPDAQIVCLLPTYTTSYYSNTKLAQANEVLARICEHYGVAYTDLRECGITTADLPDGIHPNAAGMDFITEATVKTLLDECEMEAGENVVHSVTHTLTGVKSSLSYYKGVTHGKAFVTAITGEEVTVSVTMGGVDITDAVYAGGMITIAEVTGDVVITAQGRVKTIYEDHLQQLPDEVCAGLNLWNVLEHDTEYYTASGWGVHTSGKVYSVTFPVSEGDRIYATSFGAAGSNGQSSVNGIRTTFFDADGLLITMGADKVYAEFAANGFITAPDGAVAVNIPMWSVSDDNEIYLLNRDHIYENGICTVCGEEDPNCWIVDLTAMEVSFDAEILMWTYFIIPDELLNDDGAKVLVTKNGAWGKTTTEITMAELRAAGPTAYGDYRIEQGIASGEMTREVTVQIMDGDGNYVSIRDYVSGNVDTKVVRTAADYAARVFEVGSAKQKELVKAMLIYGGYSQKHFNVDAGNPVYNLLTEYGYEIPTLEDITAADIAQEMTKSAVSNGVTYSAQEAYLDSAIYHRVYFKLAAGEEISNFRFEIELIDVHGNLYTETVTATYDRVYDEYYVDIEDIAAAHLDHLYTVTVTNLTTGDTYEVTTSVLVWAKTVIARSYNVNQVNLAKAVYYYNQAANVFFGK